MDLDKRYDMKRYLFVIGISIVSQFAVAQWKFNISLSVNGCTGFDKTYESWANAQLKQWNATLISGFPTKSECETARSVVLSSSVTDGKCKVQFTASPCVGSGGAVGSVDVLGVSKGSSFNSTNPVNEINDWSNDDMERMLALNPEFTKIPIVEISMGSPEIDKVRNQIRESAFVLDTSKPFRSLNIDEKGDVITSSPDLDMFEPIWQMEKKSRNLPDNDVFSYKDRMHNTATEQLEDLLRRSNMTKEQLEGKIWEWDYLLNNFKLQENSQYCEEKELLEKAQLLAKYKVDYKAILNLKYIDSADENKHETEAAFVIVNGKTREQYYQEELEKKEKILIESGISTEDIEIVKAQTEKEALIKDHVSTAVDIAEGVGHVNEIVFAEGDKRHDVIKDILSGVSEGATLGVMVNNLITIESYNIVADAIGKEIQGLEERHKKSEEYYYGQKEKIQSISDVVKAASDNEKQKTANMNRNEALKWSMGIDNSISRIKNHSRQDYYGAFPDIRKNEIIGREHVEIFRSRL